jgi:hypothetical protein
MSVDIASLGKGMRLRFAHPDAGYTCDREHAAKYLIEGEVYTVESFRVYGWSTEIRFVEVPGKTFNSVQFEEA